MKVNLVPKHYSGTFTPDEMFHLCNVLHSVLDYEKIAETLTEAEVSACEGFIQSFAGDLPNVDPNTGAEDDTAAA